MSSSSEEYDLDLIKKCTDHALFKDSLYTVGLPENEEIPKQINKPSLRKNNQAEHSLFKVSPEFQSYVYSKLEDRLSMIYKEKRISNIIPHSKQSTGIKLFSNSSKYLTDVSQNESSKNNSRKRKISKLNEKELFAKCSQVAVSSDWILSGKATSGWQRLTKGEVIVINEILSSISTRREEKANRKRLRQIEKRKKKKERKNEENISN